MAFIPIFSTHKFALDFTKYLNDWYRPNFRNNRCPSYSINYADYVSHDLSVRDKDTVVMRNDLEDIQYELNLICGYFTVKIKSSYDSDSYSHYSSLYKTSKMKKNDTFTNTFVSIDDNDKTKILKVHNLLRIGCSHYEIESKNILFGVSIKEMMTYYYYYNFSSLEKNEINIIKKIMNCSEQPNEKNIFGFYIDGHFILCNKFNTSINLFSQKVIYFECGYPENNKKTWFNNLLTLINKCVLQLLYFRINETFKIEGGRNKFAFESPKMLIDCLNYELEQIKNSNTTDENIYYVNICNKFIAKINKIFKTKHANNELVKNALDNNDELEEENEALSDVEVNGNLCDDIIPFVLDDVYTLNSQLRLLESTNIFTCYAIAFRSWNIGDSKIFLDFYDDLMYTHKYWFKYFKKITKQYNKKFAFPVHNNETNRTYGCNWKMHDRYRYRNSKKVRRYINSLCNEET